MWQPVTLSVREPSALSQAELDAMWALYSPHHHVEREPFLARCKSMEQVATFHHQGAIVGMVGIRWRTFQVLGEPIDTIYFGQTFVDPAHRGRLLIQRLVVKLFLQARARAPKRRVMLWNDALSYKPYLGMANHLAEFYPSRHEGSPPWVMELLRQIGAHYYPESFDPQTGTVRKTSKLLRPGVSQITQRDLEHPDIAHYARCNPEHAQGHGLLITCPLSFKNLAHFAASLAKRQRRKRRASVRHQAPSAV